MTTVTPDTTHIEKIQRPGNNAVKQKRMRLETEEQPSWLRVNSNGTKSVLEGSTEIIFDEEVFYNPVQQFNRDMSIAAISIWRDMFFLERRNKIKRKAAKRHAVEAEPLPDQNDEAKQNEDLESQNNSIEMVEEPNLSGTKLSAKEKLLEREKNKMKALKRGASTIEFEAVDLTHADYVDQRFNILEALSATGLRSIRYAKEIEHASEIIANDLLDAAVESIKRNVIHNKVENIVQSHKGDACQVMYRTVGTEKRYDVIDLDPYGSAAPFLDGAVQSVSDGGLLCITCTDMAVLAGSQPESCWSKYGGINIPGAPYTHEMALRILLHSIQSTAAKYRRTIEPLLSCSIDFYVRVFVRVRDSAALVKQAASKTSMVFHCSGCRSFVLQPIGKLNQKAKGIRYGPAVGPSMDKMCVHCGSICHMAGPFYSDPIHNPEFIARMLDHISNVGLHKYGTHTRMAGMLTVQFEELPIPLYYTLSTLAGAIHCQCPALINFVSAVIHAGYKVSQSHAAQASIKTDAPAEVIWDIMRCWCKQHPPSEKNMSPNSPARTLLAIEPKIVANFEKHPKAIPDSRKYQLVRHQENPTANWGPKARPKKSKNEA
ncbi:RNA methyltransferase tRNA(m5U54)methyltransferase [Batrachochytrium dendrobatidis]